MPETDRLTKVVGKRAALDRPIEDGVRVWDFPTFGE
jgi:hypothetical protein